MPPKNTWPQTTEISVLGAKYKMQPDCTYSGDVISGREELMNPQKLKIKIKIKKKNQNFSINQQCVVKNLEKKKKEKTQTMPLTNASVNVNSLLIYI